MKEMSQTSCTSASRFRGRRCLRRGSAPLEMVMVAPVLFAVFVLIIWAGNFMIGQAQVVVEARHQAWRKRHTEARSDEYNFAGGAGYVESESTQERRVSRLVSSFPNPRSNSRVMGDAWQSRRNDPLPTSQQRAEELNRHWNSRLQLKLGRLAGAQTLDGVLTQITHAKNLANGIRQTLLGLIGSQSDILRELVGSFSGQANRQLQELQRERKEQLQRFQNRINQLNLQINRVRVEIDAQQSRVSEIDRVLNKNRNANEDDKLTETQVTQLEDEKQKIVDATLPQLRVELHSAETERQLQQTLLNQL